MEVHHHTHTPRKKWTHYFWEFLMLFLAVFCGFLAENFRESLIIKEKAHLYMKNMVTDLKSDIASFDTVNYYMQKWVEHLDSATAIPIERLQKSETQDTFLYHFYPYYSWLNYCEQSDNTISQLKAGGFNLIHDEETIDSINAVYGFYKGVKFTIDYNVTAYWDAIKKAQDIMTLPRPAVVIEDALLKSFPTNSNAFILYDPASIQQLYNKLENSKSVLLTAIVLQKKYCEKAAGLLGYLQRKYHLK